MSVGWDRAYQFPGCAFCQCSGASVRGALEGPGAVRSVGACSNHSDPRAPVASTRQEDSSEGKSTAGKAAGGQPADGLSARARRPTVTCPAGGGPTGSPAGLSSPCIRAVHDGNLPADLGPLQLPLEAAGIAVFAGGPTALQCLLPLEELISEPQMGLDNDIQPAGSHKAVSPRKGYAKLAHDFGDADGGTAAHADAAVNQGRRAIATAAFYRGWCPLADR